MSKEIEGADLVFKALADPSRRKVLDLLYLENGQTLSALCEQLDMQRQSATQHIDILIKANLVTVVWRGREKLHFINPVPIHEVYERWVRKFETNRLGFLYDLKVQLEGENDRKKNVSSMSRIYLPHRKKFGMQSLIRKSQVNIGLIH